jgi:hypothetical protein
MRCQSVAVRCRSPQVSTWKADAADRGATPGSPCGATTPGEPAQEHPTMPHNTLAPPQRPKEPSLITTITSLGLAVAPVILQTWLKLISRRPIVGKNRLTLDDGLFWTDWVVTGTIALVALVIVASRAGRVIALPQVASAFGCMFLGYAVIPPLVQSILYDPSGKIRGWPFVLLADILGLLILFVAVAVGTNANGE